jgi:hypothetical protein
MRNLDGALLHAATAVNLLKTARLRWLMLGLDVTDLKAEAKAHLALARKYLGACRKGPRVGK